MFGLAAILRLGGAGDHSSRDRRDATAGSRHEGDTMTYIHGYTKAGDELLTVQAEFWKDRLTLLDTHLAPGTRLLEVGCGTGAVLGVLDNAFPALALSGVDIEPMLIATARERLKRPGIPIDLRVADGRHLPYADGSFDHVWIQFLLEHMDAQSARDVLQEAHRVLVPGGRLTAIEFDYHTLRFHSELDPLAWEVVRVMNAYGQSDAGSRLRYWLNEGGWSDVDPGAHHFGYQGAATPPVAEYFTHALSALMPGAAGIPDLRRMGTQPTDSIEFTVYKATARA
jgi:ubiquinone/menaquinone biosynthesis C-methylase UbiE